MSDFALAMKNLLRCLLDKLRKILIDPFQFISGELVTFPLLAAGCLINLPVNCRLDNNKVRAPETLNIKFFSLRVHFSFLENPSCFRSNAHVQPSTHRLTLTDLCHRHGLQLFVRILYLIRGVASFLQKLERCEGFWIVLNKRNFLKLNPALASDLNDRTNPRSSWCRFYFKFICGIKV